MPSMTWPSGLERPVIPNEDLPPARAARARRSPVAIEVGEVRSIRAGIVAIWAVAGTVGWAGAISGGWLAVWVLRQLAF